MKDGSDWKSHSQVKKNDQSLPETNSTHHQQIPIREVYCLKHEVKSASISMTKATKAQQWLMMLTLLLQPTFDKADYSEIYCISLFTGSRLCEVSRHAEDLLTCFLPNWSYFWNKIHEQLMMTVWTEDLQDCCHYFSTMQYRMVKCKNTSIYRCQTTFLVDCIILFKKIKYDQKSISDRVNAAFTILLLM